MSGGLRMRELTFKGFLKSYVNELSFCRSLSLFELCSEAAGLNPRLREPLLLYSMLSGKEAVLLRACKSEALKRHYVSILDRFDADTIVTALEQRVNLSDGYYKAWSSYLSVKNRFAGDAETKELMRKRILRHQAAFHITNYKIYTELNLNAGNLNSWLKHGDNNKVSLTTARKVLSFTESYL